MRIEVEVEFEEEEEERTLLLRVQFQYPCTYKSSWNDSNRIWSWGGGCCVFIFFVVELSWLCFYASASFNIPPQHALGYLLY